MSDLDEEELRATRKPNGVEWEEDKDIQVGDYVRTDDGQIVKLENNEQFFEPSVDIGIGIMPAVNGIWIDKQHRSYIEINNITKHSPNLIDLIEKRRLYKRIFS